MTELPPPSPSPVPPRRRFAGRPLVAAVIVVVAVLILAVSGMVTGWAWPGGDDAAEEGTLVEFRLEARRIQKDLRLSGTTNLSDEALLAYELTSDRGDQPAKPYGVQGIMPVSDGQFEVTVLAVPSGRIEAWVAFQTVLGTGSQQPAELIERYGLMGEKMTGPQVVDVGGVRRAESVVTVD
jgi:hypothetical protein